MTEGVSKEEGQVLLKLARACIEGKFKPNSREIKQISQEISQEVLRQKQGVFVSLHKRGKLRGCIGNIEPVKTLGTGIKENAVCAAFKDSRFSPLTLDELAGVDIEISILTPPEKMNYTDARDLILNLIPHTHGVIIKKNHHKATFLPQVWDQLPDPQDFLTHLCIKAGLAADEWEKGGLTIHTYQVQSFEEAGNP